MAEKQRGSFVTLDTCV